MAAQITYSVDLVFCVDITNSMSDLIATVKTNAVTFHEQLSKAMEAKNKTIDSLRVRVISFRDFYHDGASGWAASPFFSLPDQLPAFQDAVSKLTNDGGGDEPECGLEALATAIKSDWSTTATKRRQIIVVYSDASAHPLEKNAGTKPQCYPPDMPATFSALTDLWEGQMMSKASKRLILFCPEATPWTDIYTHWTNTIHMASKAGSGLADVDQQQILDAISNSV